MSVLKKTRQEVLVNISIFYYSLKIKTTQNDNKLNVDLLRLEVDVAAEDMTFVLVAKTQF